MALSCLGLLAGIALPALAANGRAAEQAWCSNNLRLIGRALHVWGKDHQDKIPWRIPVAEGGTQQAGRAGAAWYEFQFLSNQLVTPRILACPADAGKRMATDFSRNANGGFLNPGYRDNATSYWIGLDAGYALGHAIEFEQSPEHVLSGDRNLSVDALGQSCSTGVNNAAAIIARPLSSATTSWTNGLHGRFGNILFNDGRVQQASTPTLREAMNRGDDNGNVHLLMP